MKSNNLKKELELTKEKMKEIFKIDSIKTEKIQKKVDMFKKIELEQTMNEIEQLTKVIESPVYVGLLGRYSHGKTSLVNSLFSLTEEFFLPEGEGIVTSKITRVDFKEDINFAKAYEKMKNGTSVDIDLQMLRAQVGGNNNDSSSVEYYHMEMPTKKPFSVTFAEKNISLIDMPGLGGTYFRDTIKTRQYIENIDMLLVIIKANEIREAGMVIEPYIAGLTIPIIPVLTFGDEIHNYDLYADCSSDEEIVYKARNLLKEHIPSCQKYLTRLIMVSAKDGKNIESLRELILNFVEPGNIAITKVKQETSQVYKRKVNQLSAQFGKLKNKMDISIERFEKEIMEIIPKTSNFKSFREMYKQNNKIKKIIQGLHYESERGVGDLYSEFKNKLTILNNKNSIIEVQNTINNIEKDLNNIFIKSISNNLQIQIDSFKEEIKIEIEKYIEEMSIDNNKKKNLKENISYEIDRLNFNFDRIIKYNQPLGINVTFIKATAKTGIQTLIETIKNPNFLIAFGIGFSLVAVGNINIPQFLKIGTFVSFAGILMMIGTIIGILIKIPSIKKSNFLEARFEIIEILQNGFEMHDKKEKIKEGLNKEIANLIENIEDSLKSDISEYQRDVDTIRKAKENYYYLVKEAGENINNELRTIEASC